jgi:RNase H-like domain found in reverse transcriptase/Reverse transcriptase (RNA-dependent DNA polymerase)
MVYHQVPLDKDSRECTGFTCEEGYYQFKVMTFGFTNAPPTFQRMMSDYLGDMVGWFVEVYLNDILVHSETWEDHLVHLWLVLDRLRRVGLYTKMKKCTWGKHSVRYLGHIIGNGKLLADDDKVKAIREWKRPTTGKELQWFLGLVNYYREFIQDLAKIGWSLYKVKGEEVLEWTSEMEIAFEKIRKMAANLPYWVLWDPRKRLRVWTDSSEDGMGMVLEQLEEKGWYPLAFFSRTWRTNEKNWLTHHQEMVAFVEALQKWWHYLLDREITAETDSKFIERTNTQKATSNRLARWWEIFSEYNMKFTHIAGQTNIVADTLSRNPIDVETQVNATMEEGRLRFDYTGDMDFGKLYKLARDKNILINGNIQWKGRTCVPKRDREVVLKACHDGEGHPEETSWRNGWRGTSSGKTFGKTANTTQKHANNARKTKQKERSQWVFYTLY